MELIELPSNLRPHCFVSEGGLAEPELTHFFLQGELNPGRWTVFLFKPNIFCESDEGKISPTFSLGCFIIHIKLSWGEEYDWLGDHSNIFTIGWATEMERNEFKKFIIDKIK